MASSTQPSNTAPGGWPVFSPTLPSRPDAPRSPPRGMSASSSLGADQLSPGVSIERRTGGRIGATGNRAAAPGGALGAIGAHRTGSPVLSRNDSVSEAGSVVNGGNGMMGFAQSNTFRPSSLRSASPSFASAISHADVPTPLGTPRLVFEQEGQDDAQNEAASRTPRVGEDSRQQLYGNSSGGGSAPEATSGDAAEGDETALEQRGASMVGQLVDGDDDTTTSTELPNRTQQQQQQQHQQPSITRSDSDNSLAQQQQQQQQQGAGSSYPFPPNGAGSFGPPGSNSGRSPVPTPYLSLPQGGSQHSLAGGLLSPTAATFGGGGGGAAAGATAEPSSAAATAGGNSNAAFSPFGSPPNARPATSSSSVHSVPFGSSQARPGMEQSSVRPMVNRAASLDDGAVYATSSADMADRQGQAAQGSAIDASLRSSPLLTSVLDRLTRLELGFKDVNRHIGGLSRNVSLLLERTKYFPAPPSGGSIAGSQQSGFNTPRGTQGPQSHYAGPDIQAAALGAGQAQEDVKALGAQLSSLAGSVAQLLQLQQGQQPQSQALPPQQQQQQQQQQGNMNLAPNTSGTPQIGGPGVGGGISTPQLGTFPGTPNLAGGRAGALSPFDRSSSPRVAGGFPHHGMHPAQHTPLLGPDRGLSPRPGAGAASHPNRLSWGAGPTALQLQQQQQQQQQQSHLSGGANRSNFSPAPRHDGFGTPNLALRTRTPDIEANSRFGGMAANLGGGGGVGGAMGPPDPSVVVTKWEHLNLHTDLLRSILKYGLGPPNKIQQRALPFLLRGSDIIAQAPPTQERIASYVIPALQQILNVLRGEPLPPASGEQRGPIAMIISTTVDQATQAQRMALGLGSALGVRVHIAAAGSIDVSQEAANLVQAQPHLVVGTPQKMNDLFTYLANRGSGGVCLADVRLVVLDEVDQLIARNLADYVSTLLRILPQPRAMPSSRSPTQQSPGLPQSSGPNQPFSPFGAADGNGIDGAPKATLDRQTAIFSNTVPQDVLNFAQSIHLRESVRVLVRREGGGALQTSTHPGYGSNAGGGAGSGFLGHAAASSPSVGSGTMGLGNQYPASTGPFQPQQSNLQMQAYGNSPAINQGSTMQPLNALGASPANSNANPLADPVLAALRGLRQYYLYVAVSTGPGASPNPQMGFGGPNAHANEMKLDVITDLLEDIDFGQAVIYTASAATTEAVTYKLASKGIDAMAMHKEMASTTRHSVMSKFRSASSVPSAFHQASNMVVGGPGGSNGPQGGRKALVVHDLAVNPRDVHQVPLVVFYDLPRSVEEYKEKISCAAAGSLGRPSVCVNVVTGSGGPRGDIEMLRVIENYLGCKMAELPMHLGQILNF